MQNMRLGEKLKELREKRGFSGRDVVEELNKIGINISDKTLYGYERGIRMPNADIFVELCSIYKCNNIMDVFKCVSESDKMIPDDFEWRIIERYRLLDPYGKEAVDWILDHEHARCLNAASAVREDALPYKVIPLRRSEQPASAGRGIYLGPESFETIMVIENDLTKRALFCVPVSGDSMEPLYHNGDTLIIERNECMSIGSIGVFTLNGEGFVKELGRGELISLNPEYSPIPYDESLIQNGEVIGVLDPEWIVG